ncbi:MAG: FkbM family methyltransferase [Tannerella sp.]|jgi:FkbM family methyltransferase|nr:FkbM family methyltransferase [Tannerella sp.]
MTFGELLEIKKKPNDEIVIQLLQDSELPVVIYGVSPDVADRIVKKLRCNHIKVSFAAYDDDCPMMTDATVFLKDTEKIHTKDMDIKLSAYHVILGFVKGYSNLNALASKFKGAESIAYLSEIFDMEIMTPSFIEENGIFLDDFYNNLNDSHSKDSFVAYLSSKIWQDMKYLPPFFEKVQYFPKGIFELTGHESYFDCGAFTGDTVADFLRATRGSYRHIWAAEPDKLNYIQLQHYIQKEELANIDIVNKGIYSYTGKLPFRETGSMLSMITEESDNYIEVDTIDRIAAGNPVTYIKMDVEGAELEALKGAEQTISTYKPVLGISIYHKPQDLVDIPLYIKEIVPEYTFCFRVHKKLAIDTVLYAVVK